MSSKLAELLSTPAKPKLGPGQSILDTPEGAEKLRELVKLAKEQGYLTFDDLNEHLPESVNDPEEMELITASADKEMAKAMAKCAPGWKVSHCGSDMDPGWRAQWQGRTNVLVTHPLDEQTGCVLSKSVPLPASGKPTLRVVVAHDPQGDFDLIVRANGQQLLRKPVSKKTATSGVWLNESLDLSRFAGKTVQLELVNQPTGWSFEAAYWGEIAVHGD